MIVEALVRRKTQDMVRDAAATLLRETFEADLGGIGRIDRADLWAFDVDAADGTALVKDVLEDTTLVVNPNIHRYSLAPWSDVPESGTRLFVRVQDRVDSKGSQVLRAIRDRLGRPEVKEAQRSVLWTIDLKTADADAAEAAGRAMVGEARGAGILANPHAQDAEIRVVSA